MSNPAIQEPLSLCPEGGGGDSGVYDQVTQNLMRMPAR